MKLVEPVCVYVCSSIIDSGARTSGPIGTGKCSFDATERRNADGAGCRPMACRWHVPGATA